MTQENSDFTFTFFVVVIGSGDEGVTHTCVIAHRRKSEDNLERLWSLLPCGSQELSLGLDSQQAPES